MANLSNINGKFAVDSTGAIKFNNLTGTNNQVLIANTGASPTWVDVSTIIGGPYLPLTGGTLAGAGNLVIGGTLTVNGATALNAALTGTTATFSGLVSGITPTAAANFATKAYVDAHPGDNTTWPNVGAGIRTNYTLGFKPPTNSYAGFYFETAAGAGAGYLLIRGTSNAGQIYKAEGITLVSDASWLTLASRTTTDAGVRLMSGATSAERLVIKDNGDSYFTGELGIATSSPNYSLDIQSTATGLTSNLKLNKNSTTGDYAEIAFQLWSGAGSGLNTFGGTGNSRPSVVLRAINEDGNAAAGAFVVGTFTGGATNSTLTEKFRISSVGNVGIGTESPTDAKLEVEGNVNSGLFSVFAKNSNAGSSAYVSKKWLNDDAAFGEIWRNSSARSSGGQSASSFNMYNSADINFWSGTTHTMALVGNNVGIGATSPNEKLVLRETSNTATTTLKIEGGSYGFELSKTSQTADYVHLKPRTSGISVLRVMPNATNADSYIEVWGSDYDNDTANWNRAYMHLSASTGNFHIKTSSTGNRPVGNLILGTQNTSDAITILDNGNVGFSDTSPNLKLTVNGAIQRKNKRGNTGKHSVGHYDRGEAVWELDPTMSSQEIADLFGGTTSTVYWDQTSGQSSLAPGGWCLYLAGGVYVGGVYNSGFPYLPVETDSPTQADYYMECYIQNVGTDQSHYMGSNEFNEGFTSLGGHPGSYGYWVMSNTNPGTSWTKVSGYIGGFSASTVGTFENGTKYWTPQALFNYGAGSGTRACRISGWKVYKVYQKGNRKLAGALDVNSNINSETGYVRKSGVTSGGYIELGSLPGYGANAYQSLTSGGTIHFANNGKYCAYFEGANTYFGILNSSFQTQVKFNTNGDSFINGGNVGIGTTSPNAALDISASSTNQIGVAFFLESSTTAYLTTSFNSRPTHTLYGINTANTYVGTRLSHAGNTEFFHGIVKGASNGEMKYVFQGYNGTAYQEFGYIDCYTTGAGSLVMSGDVVAYSDKKLKKNLKSYTKSNR